MLTRLFSWLSGGWLPWVCCVAALFAGYMHGRDTAEDEAHARMAAMETVWAQQEEARARAVAEAERSARERLMEATDLANRLQADLVNKNRELDKQRQAFNRRLKDVADAARRDCAGLSSDWVRLYNEALGLAGTGSCSGSEGPSSGDAADAARAAGTPRAGVREDALTTPEDVLAHARDYGQYCRRLEAGWRALAEYAEGRP